MVSHRKVRVKNCENPRCVHICTRAFSKLFPEASNRVGFDAVSLDDKLPMLRKTVVVYLSLKMPTLLSFVAWGTSCSTARRHTPEDLNLQAEIFLNAVRILVYRKCPNEA